MKYNTVKAAERQPWGKYPVKSGGAWELQQAESEPIMTSIPAIAIDNGRKFMLHSCMVQAENQGKLHKRDMSIISHSWRALSRDKGLGPRMRYQSTSTRDLNIRRCSYNWCCHQRVWMCKETIIHKKRQPQQPNSHSPKKFPWYSFPYKLWCS